MERKLLIEEFKKLKCFDKWKANRIKYKGRDDCDCFLEDECVLPCQWINTAFWYFEANEGGDYWDKQEKLWRNKLRQLNNK